MAHANFAGDIAPITITDTGGVGDEQNVFINPLCNIDGTNIRIASGLVGHPLIAGTFMAIGRRS